MSDDAEGTTKPGSTTKQDSTTKPGTTNWFDHGGGAYAQFRPEYPAELARFLAGIAPDRRQAVDVGCGNGQLTRQLADHFARVIGLDPSADQLANALAHDGVHYQCAAAERLPVADRSTSLVTAAQAAHWFDLPAFYAEARRIARDGSVIALVSYGVPRLEPAGLQERFSHFYWREIGPYWPAERKLVDSGYADLAFPFPELTAPAIGIDRSWRLAEVLGYVSTWSAVRRARETDRSDIVDAFARDLGALWGDPATARPVSWPVTMRLGTL